MSREGYTQDIIDCCLLCVWGQVWLASRQDKTRQDKTRQDKTRQDKTRQDKTRQDKTRQDLSFMSLSFSFPQSNTVTYSISTSHLVFFFYYTCFNPTKSCLLPTQLRPSLPALPALSSSALFINQSSSIHFTCPSFYPAHCQLLPGTVCHPSSSPTHPVFVSFLFSLLLILLFLPDLNVPLNKRFELDEKKQSTPMYQRNRKLSVYIVCKIRLLHKRR